MATKVGINGFGRIGRQVLKAIRDKYPTELEVVAVNDIGDLKTMAHLLKYDSTYGRFDGTVEVAGEDLLVDGKHLKMLKEAGLISGEVDGPRMCYSINKARLARCRELMGAL